MTRLRFAVVVPLVSLSVLVASTAAYAVPITYTETVTASGSLGGVAFTNASIVLTMNNDTTNVTGGPSIFTNIGTLTLTVGSGTPVTFTDVIQAVANDADQEAGFGDNTTDSVILSTDNPAIATYDLKTAIGPLTGTAVFNSGIASNTTDGSFIIDSVTGSATFTSTLEAVPEPSSLVLFASALLGLGFLFRRGQRAARPLWRGSRLDGAPVR